MSTEARDAVLARIRSAQGAGIETDEVPRAYRTATPADVPLVERFVERVADYRATVRRTTPPELAAMIAEALGAHDVRRVVVPVDLPPAWTAVAAAAGIEMTSDVPALTHVQLDATDAVLTGCAAAIAETGTIVLDAGPGQGRRVLSLLPDVHVCVVRADQIAGDVAEVLPRLDPRRPLTWISGPSATSDIELDRVEGVHGPRVLDVIVVETD